MLRDKKFRKPGVHIETTQDEDGNVTEAELVIYDKSSNVHSRQKLTEHDVEWISEALLDIKARMK